MAPTPEVQPLPHTQRRIVFILSLFVFFISVPLLVFYAIGYRFDFAGEISNIKSVGGMYVTSEVREIEMFIDDEPVEDMRIFQSAAYIQNLEAGIHQIHTQSDGLQTWVKELPVFSHFVTESQSFNMPSIPQIRLVTQYKDITDASVLFDAATSTPLSFGSSTQLFTATTSFATSTYATDSEYTYIKSLFASSTEVMQLIQKQQKQLAKRFTFDSESKATSSTFLATTTKKYRDTQLFQEDEEVYIQWEGEVADIPYYYCIRYEGTTTIAALYGSHVEENIQNQMATRALASTDTENVDTGVCRERIRIDRLQSDVIWFDYFPSSRDLVLMHIEAGLYVVEVDDRAWQNTQLLYPGNDLKVLLNGGQIFVKDGGYYVEVFTELQQ